MISNQKVNFVSLGCAKALVDSEKLLGALKNTNFSIVDDPEKADSMVINTCGFIDIARQESIDTILYAAKLKKEGKIGKLIVMGCLSERYPQELSSEIPEVDYFFGSNDHTKIMQFLTGKEYAQDDPIFLRSILTPEHYAYIKIAEGCDRPCSFCAIPLMRGKHRSTPIEDLVTNAKSLAKKGVKEIMLIAQDLTYYGLDLYKKRALADLLKALCQVDGIDWIRLHYAYPSGFPMDVIQVMKEEPKICNYLDIPLQHGSTKVLKDMRRGITREKTTKLIQDIRNIIPDIAIRTTLIAGYPGETEADFQEMYDWVEEMQFERLGIFTYSHEENTHAYNFEDDVPQKVKKERADAIMELQSGISYELNQQRVGKQFKVLIDRAEGDYFIGRSEYDSPEVDNEVLIRKDESTYCRIGDFVEVEIVKADHYDLYAKLK